MKTHLVDEKSIKKRFVTQTDMVHLSEVLADAVNVEINRGRHVSKDMILETLEKEYGKEE